MAYFLLNHPLYTAMVLCACLGPPYIYGRGFQRVKERVDSLESRLTVNEKTTTNNAQYLRRRQLEVNNVPDSISPQDLTKTISSFLEVTGVEVPVEVIDKCHCLKNNSTVIMELKSRTVRDAILIGRKTMKSKVNREVLDGMGLGKSFISESICNELRRLDYVCRRLKKDGLISETWFFNGRLFVVAKNNKIHIEHLTDILKVAPGDRIKDYLKPRRV